MQSKPQQSEGIWKFRLFHHKTRKSSIFLRTTEKKEFFLKNIQSFILYSALGTRLELAFLYDTFLYISGKAECDHDKQDAVLSDRGRDRVDCCKPSEAGVSINNFQQSWTRWRNIAKYQSLSVNT